MKRAARDAHKTPHDPASLVMKALLPLHSATTPDWLVDVTSTAAEQTLNAAYTFVYFDHDGRLDRKPPASDLRRRSLQRAIDAFGSDAIRARIDPGDAPAIAKALVAAVPSPTSAAELLRGLISEDAAAAAQKSLGIDSLAFVPLDAAGQRIGALLLLFVEQPEPTQVRLFADHVACAAINLRQNQAARETGVIDIARAVFDARKLESDLQKELARAVRYKHEVSIAVIEATNLRLLRERFGRFLTDQLLQRLGAALAENSRDIDVIGAYKESGYTMILTQASADGAGTAAGRLLAIAQETRLAAEDIPGLELHLACGWATCPIDGDATDALFAAAERRMYDPNEQVA